MKRVLLCLIQSFFDLIPFAVIMAGLYIFIRFIPEHAGLLSISWVAIVSYVYIKYNRWY